jgi:hypothetical protein
MHSEGTSSALSGVGDIELARHSRQEDADKPFIHDRPQAANGATRRATLPLVYGPIESHQFEQNESEVWWHHQMQR